MRNGRGQNDRVWSIILAGGEGERMRAAIQDWIGAPRPKQYCTFVGTRSMLQHTLDRADQVADPRHKVSIIAEHHHHEAWRHFEGRPAGTVLLQPANRDTAVGIFYALTHVRARAPEATVVVYPSDHFVYPEERFLQLVRRAIVAAEWLTDRLVLLGAPPDRPETDYGWILPGRELGWTSGHGVRSVLGFREKGEPHDVRIAQRSGAIWNTMVMVGRVEVLWALGWQFLPDLMPMFDRISETIDTPYERAVLEQVYQTIAARNFSSDVLARATDRLAVIEMNDVLWSDWGRVDRILETLHRIGKAPLITAHRSAGEAEPCRQPMPAMLDS